MELRTIKHPLDSFFLFHNSTKNIATFLLYRTSLEKDEKEEWKKMLRQLYKN